MSNPDQKIAIVTGGSRGIGAAISRRLATDGFAVVVNYAGNEKAALEVVADIEAAGGRALAAKADVSNPAEVAALFDRTEEALGIPSVLVNSAGIMQLAPVAESSDALFDSIVDINLKGTFNTLREAARRMQDGGRIVNLSTSVVGTKLPGYGVYTATKAAVEALTAILSKELRGRNITVNAIAPGPVATELFLNGKSPELIDQLARMAPLERLGEPEDIASAVAFLAGPDGGWINGQTLRANGGLV
ncbi:3-oxoacyl-[acyl-carrier-protein] reductase FabG [Hartmannibacter diazotrophicus]|uniref:3-oxoacyl-[acyl-carrier-protein] reductase FabG n=1 Tax=Hartmannibacter diazotrophicus TaxID=1482074 RepID=A0A2C9D902_9HYPH|nr:SDR family oxidoreductase [Hartmannibacter diazotrophicus]SON56814.1 3-oxoacyl-[acyl-carrier-protein] reductase FabG [Hartmannibacter diazotrophicus]